VGCEVGGRQNGCFGWEFGTIVNRGIRDTGLHFTEHEAPGQCLLSEQAFGLLIAYSGFWAYCRRYQA
jgi:hypothetical protein